MLLRRRTRNVCALAGEIEIGSAKQDDRQNDAGPDRLHACGVFAGVANQPLADFSSLSSQVVRIHLEQRNARVASSMPAQGWNPALRVGLPP